MTSQMTNPFEDPLKQFKEKTLLHIQEQIFNEKFVGKIKDAYAEFLQGEPVVYTRNEKQQVLQEVLREIIDGILTDI